MKKKRLELIVICLILPLILLVSGCGPSSPSEQQRNYTSLSDQVKSLVSWTFSDPDSSHHVRKGEDENSVKSGVLSSVLSIDSWVGIDKQIVSDPEIIVDCSEFYIEIHGDLVLVRHKEITWQPKVDFDEVYYRIPEKESKKLQDWIDSVNLEHYPWGDGTLMFKFVNKTSPIYRLKNEAPVKIILREISEGSSTDFEINTERWINALMESFTDTRVVKIVENPDGRTLDVIYVFSDSTELQLHFIGEHMEYGGDYYSLYTESGFFFYIDLFEEELLEENVQ